MRFGGARGSGGGGVVVEEEEEEEGEEEEESHFVFWVVFVCLCVFMCIFFSLSLSPRGLVLERGKEGGVRESSAGSGTDEDDGETHCFIFLFSSGV